MTSFPSPVKQQDKQQRNSITYEIINNNLHVAEPTNIKSKLKRNYNIVTYLAIISIICFTTTFSFNGLMKKFSGESCILDTKIYFELQSNVSDTSIELQDLQIDWKKTVWSDRNQCDIAIYPPLIFGFGAIIWATMFYVCSMTSRNNRSLLPNPWRIVFPALLFFVVMAILSMVYCICMDTALTSFCTELSSAFESNSTIPNCGELINHFGTQGNSQFGLSPSVLYYFYQVCSCTVLILWIFTSAILLIRLLFGTDFRHAKVQLKPLAKNVELTTLSVKLDN